MTTTRTVRPTDAAAIAAIDAAEILDATRHFGTSVPTVAQVAERIRQRGPHPWLVAEVDGEVVGYAKASAWKSREAYAWTAELGIYLAETHRGRGIGRGLLAALIEALERDGYRTLLAGIALPNAASQALFESSGFEPIGVIPRNGYKHGAWHDVGYWSRLLGEGPPGPIPSASPTRLPIVQVDAFADAPLRGQDGRPRG